MHLPLPDNWIDALFARLTGLYGNRFTNMWTGIDAPLVRQTWASELAGMRPESIKYALDHLPEDFPPTALQFKKLCFMSPERPMVIAHDVPAQPDRIRDAMAKLTKPEPHGMKEWAYRLKARHECGDKLNANQIRCYKNALGLNTGGAQL